MDGPRTTAQTARLWAILLAIPVVTLLALNALVNVIAHRYWMKGEAELWTEYDSTLGWRHKPNLHFRVKFPEADGTYVHYDFNNLALRDTADTAQSSEREHRVLVLGDSFTEGHVDTPDTIPAVAERILNDGGIDSEVLNAGVGRYSLYQEFLLFEEMIDLAPEIAVFIFFTGNDYIDMLPWPGVAPHLRVDADGQVQVQPVPPPPEKTMDEILAEYSWFLQHSVRRIGSIWSRYSIDETTLDEYERLVKGLDHGSVGQGMLQAAFFKEYPERFEESSKLNAYVVREIKRISAEHDVHLLFVVLPSKYQVERETFLEGFERAEQHIGLDPDDKFEDRVGKDFRRILDEERIPYVDPYEELVADDRQLYWTSGHHLNRLGCAVLGQILADDLETLLAHDATTADEFPAPTLH